MKLKVLACNILWRELSLLAARCPHVLDISLIRQQLHNTPDQLRETLNQEIARIEDNDDVHSCDTERGDFDAIVVAYGLCCNGTSGLSSKKYPLIIPRAHDCITLFLGSKEHYAEYFNTYTGTFWYTTGYIEVGEMPSAAYVENKRRQYIEMYGEEDAEYLMETELGYLKEYKRATYIEFPGLENEASEAYTRSCAAELDWTFDRLRGDDSLLRDMLYGNWDDERFLTVPPGRASILSGDETILRVAE